MILPATYSAALLLLVVSMLCWGSWANAQKLTRKWRFELFYYDFSLGVLLCALVAAYTLGQMLPSELTFSDNLLIAAKRQMVWAVGAGAVFNLANTLLAGAISVSGMSVAFPISFGLALVAGVIWNFFSNSQGNAILLFGGAVLVIVAVIADAFAYSGYLDAKAEQNKKALQPDPKARRLEPRPTGAALGIVLSILSGILMSAFYPMVENARAGETGVAPYGLALLFGIGVLGSSFFYLPFFLNFPVAGAPIQTKDYLKGSKRQHLLGFVAGTIWMAGAICGFAAVNAPASAQPGPAASYALGEGAALLAALWGLLVWREFKGANQKIGMLMVVMLVLFAAGIGMISFASLHGGR